MERHVMWAPWEEPGLEHLNILQNHELIIADSVIIGMNEQEPFRVQYEICCDSDWRLRSVRLSLLNRSPQVVCLLTDGNGKWMNETGEVLTALSGCQDVDISATPFTNTLPIRRLGLRPGMSSTLKMVYIAVPQVHVSVEEQRYTCLEVSPHGDHYRYESLRAGVCWFTADLLLDGDGLVIDYPKLFRRVVTM